MTKERMITKEKHSLLQLAQIGGLHCWTLQNKCQNAPLSLPHTFQISLFYCKISKTFYLPHLHLPDHKKISSFENKNLCVSVCVSVCVCVCVCVCARARRLKDCQGFWGALSPNPLATRFEGQSSPFSTLLSITSVSQPSVNHSSFICPLA
jgi:hypothetical protein